MTGLNRAEQRLAGMIAAAIDSLTPDDRAAREAAGGGVFAEKDRDSLTVFWGGRRLLAVSWAALYAPEDASVSIATLPATPDDLSGLGDVA